MKNNGLQLLKQHLRESAKVKADMVSNLKPVLALAQDIVATLKRGDKIMIFGNGGSAADAQHFAAELVVKYRNQRVALPALALTTDSSVLTACGNDFGYDRIFARQIHALGKLGDMAIGITTSGLSLNVRLGLLAALDTGMTATAMTGSQGIKLALRPNHVITVPSEVTAHIQEAHIAIIHAICGYVDHAYQVNP